MLIRRFHSQLKFRLPSHDFGFWFHIYLKTHRAVKYMFYWTNSSIILENLTKFDFGIHDEDLINDLWSRQGKVTTTSFSLGPFLQRLFEIAPLFFLASFQLHICMLDNGIRGKKKPSRPWQYTRQCQCTFQIWPWIILREINKVLYMIRAFSLHHSTECKWGFKYSHGYIYIIFLKKKQSL
jgi:hypothetical protein